MHFPPNVTTPPQSVHVFQGYNPFPKKEPPLEIPLSIFKAARQVNATHLSVDGSLAYTTRYGHALVAKWDKWMGFGAWEECNEIPKDAVVLDDAEH